ncbi:zinc-dependent metalloprotease [Rothia sp. LK2588]|uniref:zinc-dependent metalloprotease n=1 Tax=Rothia sp. LK2588 TaxID=3114369 RepID=UPI0034CE01AD
MTFEHSPEKITSSNVLNWPSAAKVAASLAPAGPKLSPAKMRAAVESMRYAATASVDHVYNITGLEAAHNLRDSEVLVVDRATWAKANTQSFSVMLDPLGESVLSKKMQRLTESQRAVATTVGSAELGGVLAFLSTRVLGQYDPYAALAGHGAPGGRLMIVAPNLLTLEKELNVDPEDFRLWVCLHEQTHRVQFAAAPWLRDYMLDLMQQLTKNLGASTDDLLGRALKAAVVTRNATGSEHESRSEDVVATTNIVLGEMASQTLSQVTAVMSLLEGHANVVMDSVDSSIIPSVRTIRQRFNRRSETQSFLVKFVSYLLGMKRKMKQYQDGQKFVQFVVDNEGMDRFNLIWQGPENLPTEQEIHDPQAWINRVLYEDEHLDDDPEFLD